GDGFLPRPRLRWRSPRDRAPEREGARRGAADGCRGPNPRALPAAAREQALGALLRGPRHGAVALRRRAAHRALRVAAQLARASLPVGDRGPRRRAARALRDRDARARRAELEALDVAVRPGDLELVEPGARAEAEHEAAVGARQEARRDSDQAQHVALAG